MIELEPLLIGAFESKIPSKTKQKKLKFGNNIETMMIGATSEA